MILPNNGKVVIIDDQPKDVAELISALSKEKVPFVHFKNEDLSDIPESPIDHVRLIFLDLELISDIEVGSKNITSPIKTRLMRILKPRTPYALVIWSKVENKYKDALINDFETEFAQYRPVFHTSLPKSNIIGKPNAIEIIRHELASEISKFRALNAFLSWESIVNESSGKLTDEILSLLKADDPNWNEKAKFLLYKLALAYSGKAVNNLNDIGQLKNALYTLSISLSDNIENAINLFINQQFQGLIGQSPHQIENFTTVINKLLLLSDASDEAIQPGSLFYPLNDMEEKLKDLDVEEKEKQTGANNIPEDKRAQALESISKKYKVEKERISVERNTKIREFNEIVVSGLNEEIYRDSNLKHEILSNFIALELNITPLCDYAQEKAKYFRLLPGVMLKAKYRTHLNAKSAFTYISDADFRISDDDYFLLFDFRYLYAVSKEKLSHRKVKKRIKHQLLSDLQIKLGSHVNRSGVLFIN